MSTNNSHIHELIKKAHEYIDAGLSILPLREDKRPAVTVWGEYKERGNRITREIFDSLISSPSGAGWASLGVICGPTSSGFECIDIDTKYDPTGTIAEEYLEDIRQALPDLYPRLVIATTPSGGRHIYFRWHYNGVEKGQEGNQKLALSEGPEAIIETRQWGGYAAVPPAQGREIIQGDMADVPEVTDEERATLFNMARSFSRSPQPTPQSATKDIPALTPGDTPGNRFNELNSIEDVLDRAGWKTWVHGGKVYFRHPNATSSMSGNIKNGVLYMFSTSSEIPAGEAIGSAFTVHAYLNYPGTIKERMSAAAKDLAREYGMSPTRRERGIGSSPREIVPTTATIRARMRNGEEILIAAPGGKAEALEALRDIAAVYIDCTPSTTTSEIWRLVDVIDKPGSPQVQIRQAGAPSMAATTWILGQIFEAHQEKLDNAEEFTDLDRADVLNRLREAVRITRNAVTRSILKRDALAWYGWEQLGITPEALTAEMEEMDRQAAEEVRADKMQAEREALIAALDPYNEAKVRELSAKLHRTYTGPANLEANIAHPAEIRAQLTQREDGLGTGWYKLDRMGVRIKNGITLVAARTGNGKTAFMANLALRLSALNPDKVFYYLTYEENRADLYEKFLRVIGGRGWGDAVIRDFILGNPIHKDEEPEKLAASFRALDTLMDPVTGGLLVLGEGPSGRWAIEEVAEYLHERARSVKIGGLFVDYAQIAKVNGGPREGSLRDKVIEVSSTLRVLATELDIPVILAAQLGRPSAAERPKIEHIQESDRLAQDATTTILLHAPAFDPSTVSDEMRETARPSRSPLFIYVDKTRGPGKGEQILEFDGPSQQIADHINAFGPLAGSFEEHIKRSLSDTSPKPQTAQP